jgi:hypothetical protein
MRQSRETCAWALLTLALALAGCGNNTAHPGASGSSPPPASGSPTAASLSPTTAAAGERVVSSRVTYPWHWPNDVHHAASVQHTYRVPPVPTLIAISAGDHPRDPGDRPYNRMSFTFTTAFPGYQFQFVSTLAGDASGRPIALEGNSVLKVTFREAQAHTATGRTSVAAQPLTHLGFTRMTGWALAGAFEGVLTYGIGISWPIPHSNPQFAVRATEVEKVTAKGQHQYTVAIDVDATPPAGQS